MIAAAQHHLPFLLLPLVGGLLVGWFTSRGGLSRRGWAAVAAAGLVLAAAAAVSALAVVPSAAGFRLDTALAFVLVYLAGCGLGLLVRTVYLPRERARPG